jgi:acyl-coenzyme A synthetase/AMP-(fatty) acid ligase
VDTWWQTETGSIMISPLPGLTRAKPGSATRPLPGVSAALFDKSTGQAVVAYVTLGQDATSGPEFEAELRGHRARRCHHPG